jgi:arabinogalactan oligomer/maltooligosaccharide transport system permease protein
VDPPVALLAGYRAGIGVIIYPLVWTVGASLNAGNSLLSTSIIPENLSFQHYADLFNGQVNYLTWYWNSMKISLLTMILTLISVSFTAYAFSRFRFKGRQNGLMLFLLLQMIPQFSALIAIFVLSQLLGLINSHMALVLIYVAGMIPMNTYLMKGYLDAIPRDLDESARMDGASNFRIFIEIIMPLSKPIVAVVALFSFTGPLGISFSPAPFYAPRTNTRCRLVCTTWWHKKWVPVTPPTRRARC